MIIGIDLRPLIHPHRTGVGVYTFELLQALFSIDKKNTYILFCNAYRDVSVHMPAFDQKNVRFVYTRYPNKLFHLGQLLGIFSLDQFILRRVSDIDHFDYFFSLNLHFTHISSKTKTLKTIHDLSFLYFPDCYSWWRRVWHRLMQPKKQVASSRIVFVPSNNTKRDVHRSLGVKETSIQVLSPGVSSIFFSDTALSSKEVQTKYNLPSEFLLFLGTLEPRKNILAIIEAFVLAKPHLSSTCELIIAGSLGWKHGPILRAIARTSGVRYIGYVDEIDKPALYCLSTIFVFPSLYEGFGLPVLEAMASKTAVITSARSSLAEVVGDAGYLVHPLYVSEIADAIITLCTDDTLRELYRIKGYTRSCDFSWQKTAKTFLTYIEQCFMNTDQTLTFGALKEQLAVFYKERDWDQFHDPKNVADAISIEVGELLELMLWKNPEEVTSRMETDPSYRTAIEEELVDVLLYCFNFAISTNIELAPVILRKMAKNAQKYPSNVMKGNAPDRFVIAQKKAQ